MMLKEIISEIEGLIDPSLLIHTQIDEKLLEDLHHTFKDKGYTFNQYHSTLIAMGILSLYIHCHNQINNTMNHNHLSSLILKGDYFYSVYYQYCSKEAFYFIDFQFSRRIKEAEMISLTSSYPSLIQEVLNLFEAEVSQHELLI